MFLQAIYGNKHKRSYWLVGNHPIEKLSSVGGSQWSAAKLEGCLFSVQPFVKVKGLVKKKQQNLFPSQCIYGWKRCGKRSGLWMQFTQILIYLLCYHSTEKVKDLPSSYLRHYSAMQPLFISPQLHRDQNLLYLHQLCLLLTTHKSWLFKAGQLMSFSAQYHQEHTNLCYIVFGKGTDPSRGKA